MNCHQCGTDIQMTHVPGRLDKCPDCSAYLHCCLNCRFFHPSMANNCEETQAEDVSDKAAGNFCEFFQPSPRAGRRRSGDESNRARKAFDDLFKT
jgi:hypothetical protein